MVRRVLVLGIPLLGLAAASAAAYAGRQPPAPPVLPLHQAERPAPSPPIAPEPSAEPVPPDTPFTRLPALIVNSVEAKRREELKLYDALGHVDESAAQRLDEVLADVRDPAVPIAARIDRRTLQLMFRAAYHFGVRRVEVISGYRQPGKRREGLHAQARAVDFRLEGVKAAALASYLRKQPRVGVGVYTHPRTQYVHLDVRDTSFHWIDASPPRKSWREQSLGRIDPAHDAAYRREGDWPEGVEAPGEQ